MLQPGDKAPAVGFTDLEGKTQALSALVAGGPVVLAFFKVSCPTCQYALPFLGRFAAASGARVKLVSQNGVPETREFLRQYGLTDALLDDPARYPASNGFAITHVPSMFVVEPGGRIEWASTGFHRKDLEALGARFGSPMFEPGENVPDWKPG
jgi:peroxiredoxin